MERFSLINTNYKCNFSNIFYFLLACLVIDPILPYHLLRLEHLEVNRELSRMTGQGQPPTFPPHTGQVSFTSVSPDPMITVVSVIT